MIERYPPLVGDPNRNGNPVQPQAYPIGDFLGPNVVLWTTDSTAQMPATPLRSPTSPGVVTALVIRNAFSVRIGAVPLSNAELADRRQLDAQSPSKAQQDVFFGGFDGGQLTLTVNKPLDDRDYTALRQRVAAHPTTVVSSLENPYLAAPAGAPVPAPTSSPPKPELYRQEERYPPLPLYAGFNVFGPLDSVLFRGVYGHLSVADRAVDLSGSADLELGHVQGMRNANDQELLSAPLATSSESAALQFRAVGTVKVNGVPNSTLFQRYGQPIAIAGVALTVISALIGLLTFLQGVGSPRSRR